METVLNSILSRQEMERRRLAAAEELLSGCSQPIVARRYGVSRTTASRWQRLLEAKGVPGLKRRRATGRPSRLTGEQLASIPNLMAQSPREFGFESDRWTTSRLAAAIEIQFGVRYDPDHVGRIMHKVGVKRGEPAVDYRVQTYARPLQAEFLQVPHLAGA